MRPAPEGTGAAAPLAPTPRPAEGVVSWNIDTACNYRCPYCTQRFKEDRGRWSRDVPRFLEAFGRLPGRWEVKLSGGEPFLHPEIGGIVSGLASQGRRISVVTNFSADRGALEAFVAAASGRVGVFSCSLHLPYVADREALEGFFGKAAWLDGLLSASPRPEGLPRPAVCVTTVATREALPRLGELADAARAAGVPFKVQPEKQDRAVIRYTEEEERILLAFGGHNRTGRVEHRLKGRPCWAGSRYFILDDEGLAFRCYPARKLRIERMGSFFSRDFPLADGPSPCLYESCHCTVPIARGMMPLGVDVACDVPDEEVPS